MKSLEFNKIVNPTDEACYIIETPEGKIDNLKYSDVISILKTRNDVALKMIVPKGLLIIETTNINVLNGIKARQEKLLVAEKQGKFYIYCKSSFNKNTANILACGVNANTIAYTKKGTEILLPFHSKNNTLKKYEKTDIVYSNGLEELPLWLTPIKKNTSPLSKDELTLPITENQINVLINHVTRIASFTREQQKQLVKELNSCFVIPQLDDETIKMLCDSLADSFLSTFMNKNEFLHDKFGDYIIQACNIKKDKKSHQLYFYDSKKNIYTNDENYLKGYMTKICPRLKQYQKEETISYINDVLEIDSVTFNKNPFNIVFKNGILHLDEMEFEEMSPDQLETIQINANYNPNAQSETVDTFFNNVTCGDKATQQLLYESIGYAMLKTVELAKSFMVTGQGRNGKSTFFDLITEVLGEDNCAALSPNDLSNNFRSSTLVGKLASIAADISGKPLSDTDTLKNIAAGDRIQVEKKFKDAYEERLFSTLFFACNKIPKTPDNSEGYYRRWVIIPFNADLSAVKNVEGFAFKNALLCQNSIDYVAYKATLAIYNLFNTTKEFIEPDSVIQMKQAYKISNSSILSWFKEDFVHNKVNPTEEERQRGIAKIKELKLYTAYSDYADWCKETNKQALSRPNFEEEIKNQLGITWETSN